MRSGRLIFPVMAEIAPFVGAADEDPDFKEPVRRSDCLDGPGQAASSEGASYRLPCQVEADEVDALNMQPHGDAPRSLVHLVFHHRDLRNGSTPKVRDRLIALWSKRGAVLMQFAASPGVYATEARPLSFGLSRSNAVANHLRVTFRDRSTTVRRGA